MEKILMRVWAVLLLLAGVCFASGLVAADASGRAHIVILSTTDLHGHIDPIDYYTGKPEQTGLAKAATLIRQARKDVPGLLLIDCGDTIQGTPLAYYHNRLNNAPADPMMLAMNTLGYDAMTIGNHEYNFGLGVLRKAQGEAHFPWLSANTVRAGTDVPAYAPYVIKVVDGVRVGILGLTTPGVPGWEDAANYEGLEFHDPVEAAKKYVALLREKERADVVVVAMHMGLENDLATGRPSPDQQPQENAAIKIAETVPGIDVIFMGHTHREVPALFINNVLMMQANKWGDRVMRADVYLMKLPSQTGDKSAHDSDGKTYWHVEARAARTLVVDEHVAADPEIVQLAEPYDRETQVWLGKKIGACVRELRAEGARLHDTAIIDLIQRVQLDAGHADISFCASFNNAARIPAGDVSVRDLCGIYPYENTLVVVELTGAQVKEALEHSARFYEITRAQNGFHEVTENPKIPAYNCDMAEGVTYEIDPSRPLGERVVNLCWQGKPVDLAQKFRVATNNYRRNGGGGYTMFKAAPVLWRSSQEIRDLIIAWVEAHKTIPAEPTGNWGIFGVN